MIVAFIILYGVLIGVNLWGRSVLTTFVTNHQSINSPEVLTEYKKIVRWNMYGALLFIVCGIPGVAMCIYIVKHYGLLGLFLVLSMTTPSLLLGMSTKKLEKQSRQLVCETSLKGEYEKVSEIWVKKALPDF